MMLRLLPLLLLLAASAFSGIVKPPPIAYPPQGPVKGFVTEHEDGKITSQFLGIPFAEPPVGNLRFSRPQPHPVWEELYDGTEYRDSCAQNYELFRPVLGDDGYRDLIEVQTFSEDCLHINVFYPADFVDREEGEMLPVMFWIFGGGFFVGSAATPLFDGEILARETGNIVVSIDYRVDIFANLFMGSDTEYTGNLEFFDQQLALQWVHNNIRAFGGDPSCVTLFGESAGSMSVQAQMLNPDSAGLFQKAIGQSGNLNARLPFTMEVLEVVRDTILSEAGCTSGDVDSQINCLREFSFDEIRNMSLSLLQMGLVFSPVQDGIFFPDDYLERIRNGQYVNQVPSIWGSNPFESFGFVSALAPEGLTQGMTEEQTLLALNISSLVYVNNEAVYDELAAFYFPNGFADVFRNFDSAFRMFSDIFFEAPKGLTLDGLARRGESDVYEYFLKARPSLFQVPSGTYDIGATHGEDLFFIFGSLLEGGIYHENSTAMDAAITKSMMHAWGTFARTGEAEFLRNDGTVEAWMKFDLNDRNYLIFDEENEIRQSLLTENKRFINDVIERIGGGRNHDSKILSKHSMYTQ